MSADTHTHSGSVDTPSYTSPSGRIDLEPPHLQHTTIANNVNLIFNKITIENWKRICLIEKYYCYSSEQNINILFEVMIIFDIDLSELMLI